MRSRFNHADGVFSGIALFGILLTLLFAVAALAQIKDGQPSGVPSGVNETPAGAPSPILPQFLQQQFGKTGHANTNRMTTKQSGIGPMDSASPLFLPPVTYSSGGLGAVAMAIGDVNGDGNSLARAARC